MQGQIRNQKKERGRRMKKTIAMLMALVMVLSLGVGTAFAERGTKLTPGTYEATVNSIGGPLTVEVEVSENAIVSVTVTECHDTQGVGTIAAELVPERIVQNQSVNIDGVTGATLSSIFIRNAVRAALTEAGAESSDFNEKVSVPAEAQNDMDVDVVVVGAGLTGMSAAATAAGNGLKVVLVEKNGFLGGDFMISDQGIAGPGGDPATERWADMVEQMQGFGISLEGYEVEYPAYGVLHFISIPDQGDVSTAIYLRDACVKLIKENNGVILCDTPAVSLLSENGKVTGVKAQPKGQDAFNINAKAVILATGGFSSNRELVDKYLPYASGAFTVGLGGNTGDALAWVEPLNAKLVQMDASVSSFYAVNPNTGYYAEKSSTANHFVDMEGKLITEQTSYNLGAMDAFLALGRDKFYTIASEADAIAANDLESFEHMVLAGSAERFESIAQMADALNLPELPATFETLGLEDGAYYAGLSTAGIYGTYGGIAADLDGHVLDNDDAVIPGLYAAGEVIGSRNFQLHGYYAGGLGPGMVTGNIAANTAAAEIAG